MHYKGVKKDILSSNNGGEIKCQMYVFCHAQSLNLSTYTHMPHIHTEREKERENQNSRVEKVNMSKL